MFTIAVNGRLILAQFRINLQLDIDLQALCTALDCIIRPTIAGIMGLIQKGRTKEIYKSHRTYAHYDLLGFILFYLICFVYLKKKDFCQYYVSYTYYLMK